MDRDAPSTPAQLSPKHDPSTHDPEHEHHHGTKEIDETKKPFSVFTKNEKWAIVAMAGVAGLFSPLTANIYFPAIPTIAAAFNKSVELINLTVTVYMVVQGISPMLWGSVADRYGRRPIFMSCLLVLILTCIGLALVPTSDYWLLMLLRCFQAAGSASTIALGAGIIVDIATPAERGGFLGLFTLGPMVGPCLGPVIGGVLEDKLGWRAIFWFLAISTGACFIFMLSLLPETLRSIVGDGSIAAPKLYMPLIPIIGRKQRGISSEPRPSKVAVPNPLRLFTYPDVLVLLLFNATVYAVFYSITTTISSLFETDYPFLSETAVGLCYLAIGGGMAFGGLLTGRLLDSEYRSVREQFKQSAKQDSEKGRNSSSTLREEEFPIERARLRLMPINLGIYVACCIGYGWCLEKRVHIAGPLILQVILGCTVMGIMNTTQTLIMDLFPSQGSSITAANNLVRCSFGAALVAVIDLIVNALGAGWTFVLLAGVCVLVSPLMFWEMRMGPTWRQRRRMRLRRQVDPDTDSPSPIMDDSSTSQDVN